MNTEYWQEMAAGTELPVRPVSCADCAVDCGFYIGHLRELQEQPEEIQQKAVRRWFCHTSPRMACKGAYDEITGVRE